MEKHNETCTLRESIVNAEENTYYSIQSINNHQIMKNMIMEKIKKEKNINPNWKFSKYDVIAYAKEITSKFVSLHDFYMPSSKNLCFTDLIEEVEKDCSKILRVEKN